MTKIRFNQIIESLLFTYINEYKWYFFIVKNKKIGGDMNGFLGMVKILVRIIKIQEK